MKWIITSFLLFSIFNIQAQQVYNYSADLPALTVQALGQNEINIIPEPVSIETAKGSFELTPRVKISVSPDEEAKEAAELFSKQLATSTGYHLPVSTTGKTGKQGIFLLLNKHPDASIGEEGYNLDVNSKRVEITANTPAGIFYGLQTLVQLLPPSVENTEKSEKVDLKIPAVSITDYPRFGWRGLMLDVSRHFFTTDDVKSYIDQMVKYKYNVFHWHLTDNQGWRIEIKSLPKLTEVGAWRVPRTGSYGTFQPPQPGEKATEGGYYTQEEIREIIKYAQERFVTIVPEVDVPGHSLAFIASYPEASCTGLQYSVNPKSHYGHENESQVFCAGKDRNFEMLDDVFSEIADLFPGEYIHVGGDEVDKTFWKKCEKCQKRMADEGLHDVHELQSYFIKRVGEIIESKGKKMIGWDEIMEGGLAPGAAVMSWRGTEGGIEASKAGHNVVMTPTQYAYLDYVQGDYKIELHGGGKLSLSQAYNFEPVPEGAVEKYILGGQGNLWTENVPTLRRAEYMTWPRALALAEVYWSLKEKRDWNDFVQRMEAHFPRFDAAKVKYATSAYDPKITPVKDKQGNMQIAFDTEIEDLEVFYTFNNTFPDNYSNRYKGTPVEIPTGASEVRAINYRGEEPVGRYLIISIEELKGRLN